jgi:hypothetical protein
MPRSVKVVAPFDDLLVFKVKVVLFDFDFWSPQQPCPWPLSFISLSSCPALRSALILISPGFPFRLAILRLFRVQRKPDFPSGTVGLSRCQLTHRA